MNLPSKAQVRARPESVWMIVFFSILHLVLYVATLSNLLQRPPQAVRGRKEVWTLLLTLNFSSPIWIWLLTRRFGLTEIVPFVYFFYGRKRLQ